jgi:hypothetical protein
MGCVGFSSSYVLVVGVFGFLVWVFFCLCWDGESGFFVHKLCGMGGMGIVHRKIVSTNAYKVDQQEQPLLFLCLGNNCLANFRELLRLNFDIGFSLRAATFVGARLQL